MKIGVEKASDKTFVRGLDDDRDLTNQIVRLRREAGNRDPQTRSSGGRVGQAI